MARDAGSRAPAPEARDRLRGLPSVEELAGRLGDAPHPARVRAAREAIAARRRSLQTGADGDDVTAGDERDGAATPNGAAGADALERDALRRLAAASRPRLRPVLNATGVIVHTNLGRAPLAPAALDAVLAAGAGYSNLEYDLERGRRGSRHDHVAELLAELTGAEAALVVNNCAAATLLACAALAAGREVVVSRGQLVEIGGSYRIPDVVVQSGARLVEVGTTNRTRRADYARAIGAETAAIMRAHPSNYRVVGFTEEVSIETLAGLAAEAGVALIDDLGSGALAEDLPALADEPGVRRSVAAGATLVCFSGDKLLGGPQAGVIVGSRVAVEACRAHPLARAMRIDKLSLAALEATLALYRDPERAGREIPVLAMLAAGEEELEARARRMADRLLAGGATVEMVRASGRVGGGALPLEELEGPVCLVDPAPLALDELAARLRRGDPPVVARARARRLLLDPRTLDDEGADAVARAVLAALSAPPS